MKDAGVVEKPKGGDEFFDRGLVRDAGHEIAKGGEAIGGSEEFQHVAGKLKRDFRQDALDLEVDGENPVEWFRLGGDFFAGPISDGRLPLQKKIGIVPWWFNGRLAGENEMALDRSGDQVEENGQFFGAGRAKGIDASKRKASRQNARSVKTCGEMEAGRAKSRQPIDRGENSGMAWHGCGQGVAGESCCE